jgi:hypothetical protein
MSGRTLARRFEEEVGRCFKALFVQQLIEPDHVAPNNSGGVVVADERAARFFAFWLSGPHWKQSVSPSLT